MNTDDLEYQQAVAEQEAKQFLNSYEPYYKAVINALLVVMDTIGVCKDPETPAGATQSHIAHKYYEAPFTHWEFYRMLCRGSYLTAAIRIKLRVTGHQKLVSIRYFLFFIHPASLFKRCLNDLQAVRQRDGIHP